MNLKSELHYCHLSIPDEVVDYVEQYKAGLSTVTELVMKLKGEFNFDIQIIKSETVVIQIPVNINFVEALINVEI